MAFKSETKVGVVVLICLLSLALIIIWKSAIFLRAGGYELVASFGSIEGLNIGSEVRYRGLKVGKIVKVDPGPEDIKCYAIIEKNIKFPSDSYLRVAYDGIVGMKYLDIRPGVSSEMYKHGDILFGKSTAGIVDFVDVGTQNLEETKKILATVREFITDPKIVSAYTNAVLTADKITKQIEYLTLEIRKVVAAIDEIVDDPKFQANLKGTIRETEKTLASANNFFGAFGALNFRPGASVDVGTRANSVRANIDIVQKEKDFLRLGVGEGPTRSISLLDLEISREINPNWGLRLGMINTKIGAGVDYYANRYWTLSGDIYDINNTVNNQRLNPKLRLTSEFQIYNYVDLFLRGDDLVNSDSANYSLGVKISGN